jgi:hypothetical protein
VVVTWRGGIVRIETAGRAAPVVLLGVLAATGLVATPGQAAAAPAPSVVARPAVSGTPGPASVTVTWTPGPDQGSPITGFTVTAADVTAPARGHQTCVVGVVSAVTTSTPAYLGPDACTVRRLTAGDTYTFTVTATNVVGTSPSSAPSPPVVPTASVDPHPGYWLAGSDGGIFSFGAAAFHGSTGDLVLQRPVVGMVPTADHAGYWEVASDGGIFAFGDAGFYGSIPGLGIAPADDTGAAHRLNAPIVATVPSTDGRGYFLVGADGGVFAFGDATFAGSCPGIGTCPGSAVSVLPDATGRGYWLVTSVGAVYAFGDAPYEGAPGPTPSPITSAVHTLDGAGYLILTADGSIYAYGDAHYLGGTSTAAGTDPATAVFTPADDGGYWIVTANGAVTSFGTAPDEGGMSGGHLNGSIVAAAGI